MTKKIFVKSAEGFGNKIITLFFVFIIIKYINTKSII